MLSRRDFVNRMGATLATPAMLRLRRLAAGFSVSVITDEITQDLGRACEIAARDWGLGWVELRPAHDKNIMSWDAAAIAEARRITNRYNLRVSTPACGVC